MVVDDAERAAALCRQGHDVVLIVVSAGTAGRADGPGRLAVLVGDPTVAETRAAAAEMDAELFGLR